MSALVDRLGEEFRLLIVTSDRDLGQREPYPGIAPDTWLPVGNAQVRYLPPGGMRVTAWRRLLNETAYDLLYLNGFFGRLTWVSLWLRRFGGLRPVPVIVAPRGEFTPGALAFKAYKKRPYLVLANVMGLWRGVTWQASSEADAGHIAAVVRNDIRSGRPTIHVAPNLIHRTVVNSAVADPIGGVRLRKQPGAARLVFLSRISPKKNLKAALESLTHVSGAVQFDIYGPIEDPAYWRGCRKVVRRLPSSVEARYLGEVKPSEVLATLAGYHALLFPTLAENFGHVIAEALAAGCLVLTSDRTPWRGLVREGVGWDLPLTEPSSFVAAIQEVVALDEAGFRERSKAARALARAIAEDPARIQATRRLLLSALEGT